MPVSRRQEESTDNAFQVDVSPDVSALRIFKSLTFTPWYALGEFVDNAVTSALKNASQLREKNGPDYKLRVEIDFHDDGSLVVTDNAAGITHADFSRALRTGQPPPDTSIGLSVHGAGMKAAAFWWGRVLEIETWPLDSEHGWAVTIDVEDVAARKSGNVTVEPIPGRGFPGTRITIRDLWQKVPRTRTLGVIKAYLPSIYRIFLRDELETEQDLNLEMIFQGEHLQFTAPELLEEPFWPTKEGPGPDEEPKYWKRSLVVGLSSGKQIDGWIGLRSVMSRDMGGFFLHFRGKGVAGVTPDAQDSSTERTDQSSYKPRQIFGQQGSYRDQTIIGEFNVSDFGKSLTTDSVTWSESDEEEFIEAVLTQLQDPAFNMWAMAENFRRSKKRRDAKQNRQDEAEIKEVVSELSDSLAEHGIDHLVQDEPPLPPISGPNDSFTVSDREGHEHRFEIIVINDRSQALLQVRKTAGDGSQVIINEAHPALDNVSPVEGKIRAILVRFCLALGAAEIFSTSWDRSQVRRKFNEILDIQSRR